MTCVDRVVSYSLADLPTIEVWDELGAANPGAVDGGLCAAGAQIKTGNFAGKLHRKFAVIDGEGGAPVVVLGSYNWTDGGLTTSARTR